MPRAYLSLGSNIGDRKAWLSFAATRLEEAGKILALSSIYETEPWGFNSPTAFLNQVLLLDTELSPRELLRFILETEKEAGRLRARSGYIARNIDIDILLYDGLITADEELIIPHPRLAQRLFVLRPLAELEPSLEIPGTGMTAAGLLEACTDDSWIEVFDPEP